MRIAFYAPLKRPDHPVPSGDRALARLFHEALGRAGHDVAVASGFQSRDGAGDPVRQARIAAAGDRLAERLVRRYGQPGAWRPDIWFTYHLYYKAPDWIGPRVSDALGIPYVVAEASHAPKRRAGPWADGQAAATAAIRRADLVFALSRDDMVCLPELVQPERLIHLVPFVDTGAYAMARADARQARRRIAAMHGFAAGPPWLLAVGMMREGEKLRSYALLAGALSRLGGRDWRLLVAGDGPAREAVRALFRPLAPRVHFLGAQSAEALPALYAAADLMVWPAVGEALGLAMLEAQAAGLPVVSVASRGVPDLVADGETGLLAPPGDPAAFAAAVATLLEDAGRRKRAGRAAAERVARRHDVAAAAAALDRALAPFAAAA